MENRPMNIIIIYSASSTTTTAATAQIKNERISIYKLNSFNITIALTMNGIANILIPKRTEKEKREKERNWDLACLKNWIFLNQSQWSNFIAIKQIFFQFFLFHMFNKNRSFRWNIMNGFQHYCHRRWEKNRNLAIKIGL